MIIIFSNFTNFLEKKGETEKEGGSAKQEQTIPLWSKLGPCFCKREREKEVVWCLALEKELRDRERDQYGV